MDIFQIRDYNGNLLYDFKELGVHLVHPAPDISLSSSVDKNTEVAFGVFIQADTPQKRVNLEVILESTRRVVQSGYSFKYLYFARRNGDRILKSTIVSGNLMPTNDNIFHYSGASGTLYTLTLKLWGIHSTGLVNLVNITGASDPAIGAVYDYSNYGSMPAFLERLSVRSPVHVTRRDRLYAGFKRAIWSDLDTFTPILELRNAGFKIAGSTTSADTGSVHDYSSSVVKYTPTGSENEVIRMAPSDQTGDTVNQNLDFTGNYRLALRLRATSTTMFARIGIRRMDDDNTAWQFLSAQYLYFKPNNTLYSVLLTDVIGFPGFKINDYGNFGKISITAELISGSGQLFFDTLTLIPADAYLDSIGAYNDIILGTRFLVQQDPLGNLASELYGRTVYGSVGSTPNFGIPTGQGKMVLMLVPDPSSALAMTDSSGQAVISDAILKANYGYISTDVGDINLGKLNS